MADPNAIGSADVRPLPAAEWAMAHVLVAWRREVGPQLRKVYKAACNDEIDRDDIAAIAARVEGFGRALRAAADPAQTRDRGPRFDDEVAA